MNNPEPGSRSGSRFGPYLLGPLLAPGVAGDAYRVEDTRTGETVSLTLIDESLSADKAFCSRFEEEAEAAGQLAEPHLQQIRAYGEIDRVLYLETSLIEATDLAALLDQQGPLSAPRAVAVVRQVAAALDEAHHRYVVHGDVRPDRIRVTGDDLAYLTDFAVAAAVAEPGEQADPSRGTISYMAPERLTGEQVTHLADIYSLACVLAESLGGVRPFSAETVEQAIEERRSAPLPQPSTLRPGLVPVALDAVLARGLAGKPEERYSSAGELAAAAYQALSEPERHQVSRILRRGEPALHLSGGLGPETSPQGGDSAAGVSSLPMTLLDGQPLTQRPPALPAAPRRRRRGRKPVLVATAAAIAAAVVFGVGHLISQPSSATGVAEPLQDVLAFSDLGYRLGPGGLALDADGNMYVSSSGAHPAVVRRSADSQTSTVLPSTDAYQPRGVALDSAGNVYFSDALSRVVKLAPGSDAAIVLPFLGLDDPDGVAVDSTGNVYVADRGNDVVFRLDPATGIQTTVPFVGLSKPDGVALDSVGDVYVTDTGNNRVLKLAAATNEQVVLPFAGIVSPWGIAVDDAGDVVVTENTRNKVVKLPTGAGIPVVLPFTGLNAPRGVAIDKHGAVYVADRGNDRVLKLGATDSG